MDIETQAKLLTAESKPYSVDGNTGTSHKVRLNINGEIYVCKSTPEQVSSLQPFVGQEGIAFIQVVSRKENMGLILVTFKV